MSPRVCALIALVAMAVGCVPHLRVYQPFKEINTMLVEPGATNMLVASAKAIVVDYRRTVEKADGTTEAKRPKLIVVDYDDLRNLHFVNQGFRTGNYTAGAVHSRESILVYRSGFEPAWLERKFFGKTYRYPTKLVLVRCDPVKGRKMVFDAIAQIFRGETESYRRATLTMLADKIK